MGRLGEWRGELRGEWAGALLALFAVTESIARIGDAPGGLPPVALLLGLFTTLPLTLPRASPAAVAVAVSAAGLLSIVSLRSLTVAGLAAQLIVLYRLGRSGSQLLPVLLVVPFVVPALVGSADTGGWVGTLPPAVLTPVAAAAGIARWARTEALEHTAARRIITDTLLEHTAQGERARIARELHDVVAHHISMIAVQAETARLATPGMPADGAKRLLAIGDTARAALTEMRRLLGVLREDGPADAPAERRPQPGLQQLNELLDESRDASGACTRLTVRGPVAGLDPGVELAAYRIIQEALTNARRHAPGAAIDVELHYTGDTLRLRVRDLGPGPGPSPGSPARGHGLLGMRERSTAVGGELRTGPAAGGGFLVEATLPGRTDPAG